MKLPRRYAPFVYGIIQSALTTGVATGIASFKLMGTGLQLFQFRTGTWVLSWLTMLPVVLLLAPVIQRAVVAMTAPDA